MHFYLYYFFKRKYPPKKATQTAFANPLYVKKNTGRARNRLCRYETASGICSGMPQLT